MHSADSRVAKCPSCDALLLIRMNQIGRIVQCNKCKYIFTIDEKNTFDAVASARGSPSLIPQPADDVPEPAQAKPTSSALQRSASVRRAKVTARLDYTTQQLFHALLRAIRECNCDLGAFDKTTMRIPFSFYVNGVNTEHDAYAFEATRDTGEIEIVSKDPNIDGVFDPYYEAILEVTKSQLRSAVIQQAKERREEEERRRREELKKEEREDLRRRRVQRDLDDEVHRRPRVRRSRRPNDPAATAGFICGLVGLVLFWLPIFGLVLGIIGVTLGGSGMKSRQKGMAIAGLVLGILAVVLSLIVWIAVVGSESRRRSSLEREWNASTSAYVQSEKWLVVDSCNSTQRVA